MIDKKKLELFWKKRRDAVQHVFVRSAIQILYCQIAIELGLTQAEADYNKAVSESVQRGWVTEESDEEVALTEAGFDVVKKLLFLNGE
jgi:hypothetical protein